MEELPHEVIVTDDVFEVVSQVFSQPPKSPYTYQMDIDAPDLNPHKIFQTLGQFLTHGIVYLYGEDVDITTLTPQQLDTIQDYLKSFGWQAVIQPTSPANHPNALPYMLSLPIKSGAYINIIFEPLF